MAPRGLMPTEDVAIPALIRASEPGLESQPWRFVRIKLGVDLRALPGSEHQHGAVVGLNHATGISGPRTLEQYDVLRAIPQRCHVAGDHHIEVKAHHTRAEYLTGVRREQLKAAIAARVPTVVRRLSAHKVLPHGHDLNALINALALISHADEAMRAVVVAPHHARERVDVLGGEL
jgi:hypothetical protein